MAPVALSQSIAGLASVGSLVATAVTVASSSHLGCKRKRKTDQTDTTLEQPYEDVDGSSLRSGPANLDHEIAVFVGVGASAASTFSLLTFAWDVYRLQYRLPKEAFWLSGGWVSFQILLLSVSMFPG